MKTVHSNFDIIVQTRDGDTKKNISSHQDIWIIFTHLFGQSNNCIMIPK